ncbi:LppA family lipoprotein [Mycobacterium sp. E2989]|nr:LppA family lipoprotein [Mycobacterium sp. E2989]
MLNNPGIHYVGFYGPTGIFIKVGYRGNLVVWGIHRLSAPTPQEMAG